MRSETSGYKRFGAVLSVFFLLFAVLLAAAENIWPSADGKKTDANGILKVDYSHSADGYIMVRGNKTDRRLKLRVSSAGTTLTYDLNSKGEYEVIPLQFGSGNYKITIYRNVSGKKYSEEGSLSFKFKLNDENAAFLCPNQFVSYTKDSPAVKKAQELCAGLKTDLEKFEAIRSFIEHGSAYDFVRAVTVSGTVLPDVDGCYKKKMGICQDLSALMVCMLRSQGVHTKLMIGYAGENYHAWVAVILDGSDKMYDPTAALGGIGKNVKYSLERFY